MDKEESEREKTILKNIGLVRHLIKPYLNGRHDVEDLLHSGIVGLCEAVDRYHPERGAAFSTFASYYIIDNALEHLNRHALLRLPEGQRARLTRIRRAEHAYLSVYHEQPTDDYLAEHLRSQFPTITPGDVRLLRKAWREPASLDKIIGDDGTLHDSVGTPDDNKAEQHEDAEMVKRYLAALPPLEQAIIRHKFYDHMEFRDIGNKLGKGLSIILTHYRKALRDLRIMADKNGAKKDETAQTR